MIKPLYSHQQGFSLLEILVAFSILALSLGVLFQSFTLGLRNVRVAEDYTLGVLLAQSQLALVGADIPLQAGETQGDFTDYPRYHWSIQITPYPLPDSNPDWVEKIRQQLFTVNLQVRWETASAQRQIQINTLRITDKPADFAQP